MLPDVPTLSEAGLPGYDAKIWVGLMAPKGTPKAVVDKLNDAVTKVASSAEVKAQWGKQGAAPILLTAEAFDKYIKDDIDKWAKVIKTAGIKAD